MPGRRRGLAADKSLLEAALMGFEQMMKSIDEKIAGIRRQLGARGSTEAAVAPAQGPRRRLSAAARGRIAAAQRKRWAELKKAQAKKNAGGAAGKKASEKAPKAATAAT
ncbi:MAG TPA: hypothetical protein VMT32_00580 [Bryobacteraceae bacterium]|nr:hypothetical protein [Bryobacteraceae bacterium]